MSHLLLKLLLFPLEDGFESQSGWVESLIMENNPDCSHHEKG